MNRRNEGPKTHSDARIPIIVAVIGLVGVLSAALIANIDKFSRSSSPNANGVNPVNSGSDAPRTVVPEERIARIRQCIEDMPDEDRVKLITTISLSHPDLNPLDRLKRYMSDYGDKGGWDKLDRLLLRKSTYYYERCRY